MIGLYEISKDLNLSSGATSDLGEDVLLNSPDVMISQATDTDVNNNISSDNSNNVIDPTQNELQDTNQGDNEILQNQNVAETSNQSVAEKKDNSKILLLAFLAFLIFVSSKKEKKMGKITTSDVVPYLLIGGGLLTFDIVRRTLEGFGIWTSKETKQLNVEATNPNSAWNPNFYKNYSYYSYAITRQQAEQMAKQIYDAFGMFNDCEECVKSVFYSLKTKSNVSYLSDVFQQVYGQALLPFLRGGLWPQDRLSDSDVSEINNYINNLKDN